MKKVTITDEGLLIDETQENPISFAHSSMAASGIREKNIPQYAPVMSYVYLRGFELPSAIAVCFDRVSLAFRLLLIFLYFSLFLTFLLFYSPCGS
jgi:hypothetical protein